jgi:hypothetical protein
MSKDGFTDGAMPLGPKALELIEETNALLEPKEIKKPTVYSGLSRATAAKYDKPQPFLGCIGRFPRAILAVAEVSLHGTKKHKVPMGDMSFLDIPDAANQYREAKCRHMLREVIEGEIDPDFDLLHAAHEAWDALARLEKLLVEREKNGTECD